MPERASKRRKLDSTNTAASPKNDTRNTAISRGAEGGNAVHEEDVEMQDALVATSEVKEDLPDLDSRRTSGRKRQASKKLEEAQLAVTPTRGSPAVRSKASQPQRTPVSSARKANASRALGTRSARSSAAKKKKDLPDEIPDSEPETEPQTKPAKSPVDRPRANGDRPREATLSINVTKPKVTEVIPKATEHGLAEKNHQEHNSTAPTINVSNAPTKVTKRPGRRPKAAPEVLDVDNDEDIIDVAMDDDLDFENETLRQAKVAVMARLSRRPPKGHRGSVHPLIGLDNECQKVAHVIEQAIVAGESNSIVLIGARGSGKSALVDNIIREQQMHRADEFHVVRLSGFIHTDDKIAIRDIWRQLGREMEIEDDSLVKNYADTLTTLLALLSHPSETGQEMDGRMAKSVIIILDEFDLFTTHPRQTLLYNLFDIAQSRKAPVAVLGLTTRFDVAEALEKRVKSRFSHRQTYLPLARNLAAFKGMCQAHLTLSDPRFGTWNSFITGFFSTSVPLNNLLQQIYHTSKSVPAFLTAMWFPMSTLPSVSGSSDSLTKHLNAQFSLAPSLEPPDSLLSVLPSLSSLQLALLIAAARLVIIHDTDTVSFPLTYDEYKALASKARIAASAAGALAAGQGARVWSARVARMAWEGLGEKGLVAEEGGRGASRVDVSLEEIGIVLESGIVEGVGAGVIKWCKEI